MSHRFETRRQFDQFGLAERCPGAVILGKTNLSEWANFRSFESSSGWSGRGGQTNNPYGIDRNPCGSSSGPGAAGLAAGPGYPIVQVPAGMIFGVPLGMSFFGGAILGAVFRDCQRTRRIA